ncbi:MAG TPA: hypothetical protein VMV10_16775 [Pirellulales bacterium]|nr:hypothetical protein [Pirellulales bacterium]
MQLDTAEFARRLGLGRPTAVENSPPAPGARLGHDQGALPEAAAFMGRGFRRATPRGAAVTIRTIRIA